MAQVYRSPQVFRPRANTLFWLAVLGLILGASVALGLLYYSTLSPTFVRLVGVPIEQPVPFNHQLHVSGLRLQCLYCHTNVTESAYANVPATQTCMSCHSAVKPNSPALSNLVASWESGTPIQWNKVHDLPDFVYFNHSIHVAKGVGCSTCHGNVAQMGYRPNEGGVYRVEPLYMGWCLGCHRAPENYVRPQEEIFNTAWEPPANQVEVGQKLVQEYGIRGSYELTRCAICHR